MYAIKKHINKVLAAFLCACLLLSYNPAFGTATTAWADDTASDGETFGAPYAPTGSHTQVGEMDNIEIKPVGGEGSTGATLVEAGTFTSDLLVNITEGPLFATTGQIKDSDNPFELIAQATCSEADNLDDYEFKWTVTANGKELTKEQQDLINSGAYNTYAYDDTNNVASVSLDMKKLIKNNPDLFQDDVKYDFTCKVTMKATDPVKKEERNVTLLTVSKDLSDSHSKTRLQDESKPTPVVATGHFLSTAELKTELASENRETVIGPLATEAQRGSTDYEKFDLIRDKDGKASQVYQVGVEGSLEVSDTITLGAAKGSYDLWFPIDEQYVYDPVKNPTGYQQNDLIAVLWKDRYTNTTEDLQRLTAEIVYDAAAPEGTGKLMAKITYNPTEVTGGKATIVAKDEAGKDKTYTAADGVTNLPGFFALVYSSNKTAPKDGETSYYSVSAKVNDENKGTLYGLEDLSTLKMDGEPVYVVTGTSVRFNVLPQVGNDGKRYQLTSLKFKNSPTAEAKEVLNGSTKDLGITIDAANSCVVIGKPACDQFYAAYSFEATFDPVPDDMANYSEELVLRVVNEDDMSTSNHGVISTSYTKLGETDPQRTQGNDYTVLVQHGGYADLNFMVNAGLNDTNYEIKRVEASATGADNTWAPAAWMPGCQLSLPHITGRMYVRVVVGIAKTTVSQPLYYNVIVKAADGTDPRCQVKPESGIIAVNNATFSELDFSMTGVADPEHGGFYAQKYTVKEGDKEPVEFDLDNDKKKDTGTFRGTYKPSTDVLDGTLKGDIVIEVTFHTTNPTPRQLTVVVEGGNGSATLVGGGLLDEDGVATVGSGERFTLLMVPDSGWDISSVRVKGTTIKEYYPTRVKDPKYDATIAESGIYSDEMPDEDETIYVVFKKVSALKDESAKNAPRTVSVYVADESLKKNDSVKYIWDDIKDADISLDETSNNWGEVNSVIEMENARVPMGSPYVLNFQGFETDGSQHAVSKVLVVPYNYDVNDPTKKVVVTKDDGTLDYKLIDWNAPAFELNYATWGLAPRVDVIVYFDKVTLQDGEKLNQPKPDEYVTVDIPDAHKYLKEGYQPDDMIQVLPGGYVTITDMYLDDDNWVWDDDPIVINGTPISDEDFKKLKETGSLEIGPVYPPENGGNYKVVINAKEPPEDDTPKYFDVYADDPANPHDMKGDVWVTPQHGTRDTASWDAPFSVDNGDSFTLGFEPWSNDYELTQVKFDVSNWYPERDSWPIAWYKLITAEGEGEDSYYSLIFQTDDEYKQPGDGYKRYTGQAIPITDESPTEWHVSGLSGDLTVLATFSEVKEFDDPNKDVWKVQTAITTGKGSVTMTYNGVGYGNQVNVKKGSQKPVTIQIAPVSGYQLKSVVSKTTSDNPLVNIWDGITGQNTTNLTQSVTASGGSLVISPVNLDYLIEIEFECTDDSKLDTTTIPVNVFGDTNKGTIEPNTNVRAKRDGQTQFVVDVKSVTDDKNNKKWYSIDKVEVTPYFIDDEGKVTKGTTQTVPTSDTSGKYVTWQDENNVVFTVDIASVGNSREDLSAVDVEVVYGPANLSSHPDPDANAVHGKKKVTITANTGGLVAPLGEFDIYPYKVGNDWAEVLGVVTPTVGYGLKSITVQTNEGTADVPSYVKNDDLAAEYMQQIRGDNNSSSSCFYIKANPTAGHSDTMKDEKIHVTFEKLSVAESTYTIHVKEVKRATGVSGTVVTTKDVTLPVNQSFSYCVNTTGSNTAVKVTDQYRVSDNAYEAGKTDDGAYFDVPASAATDKDKTAIQRDANNNIVLVNPAAIRGQVVDRWLTFEFVTATGDDDPDKVTPIPDNKKANIKVSIHSEDNSNAALTLTPRSNLNNIIVSDMSNYAYNWYYPESANKNYYVYCVKVNGEVVTGAEVPTNGKLYKDGYFVFETGNKAWNLKAGETNTLDIYTGTFVSGQVPTVSGGGGRFEVEAGEGGWILDNNGGFASIGSIGTNRFASTNDWMATYASVAGFELDEIAQYGGDLEMDNETTEVEEKDKQPAVATHTTEEDDDDILNSGSATDNKNKIETYTIVPAPGYVIDHVYLYQCHILDADSWAWLKPKTIPSLAPYQTAFGESWDKDIVLQYTLELDQSGADAVGYMYTSYKYVGTDKITNMPWKPTDEDRYSNLGNDNLQIEFYPANYAEAIAEYISDENVPVRYLHQGTKAQDGTVAAFGHTESKSGNSYMVKFSTFDVIDEDEPYTFLVGPLLPEDGTPNAADKLYTIKQDELKKKMPNVEVKEYIEGGSAAKIAAADDENEGIDTQADNVPSFYRYYTVSGKASDLNLSNDGKSLYMQLPLDKLTVNSGNFPELPSLDKTVNENTTYELAAYVEGEGGSITPTSTSSVPAWNDGDNSGPWTVKRGTTVAFKVEADDGFVLTSLKRNGLQRLNAASREYNASTSTFVFSVFADTEIVAEFTPDTDANASRTVTISVQGGHGTTSPTPGVYPVQKGKSYSITFVPESGYVPYRIWVDGVESFAGPTWLGYTLPASWSNQTFTVQYAVAGTTPTTGQQLVQTGQNVLNDAATGLVRTGDNPVAIACIVGVAVLAAVGVWQMRRRKATAARAAKYSVTKRRTK